jgi:hypothetical protein
MKNTFWGVHSGGQNVSKMDKVVQSDGLIDAHILVKQITILDC